MNTKDFEDGLKEMNVHCITPDNSGILKRSALVGILDALQGIASKTPGDSFGMMPRMENVNLMTGEACHAVAHANFVKGEVHLISIYLYDYTKLKYQKLYNFLQSYFTAHSLN